MHTPHTPHPTHPKNLESFGAFKRGLRAKVLTWVPKHTEKSVPKNVDDNLVGF